MIENSTESNWRWLFCEMKPDLLLHVGSLACIMLVAISALIDPLIIKWVIDVAFPKREPRLVVWAAAAICLSLGSRVLLSQAATRIIFHASQQFILRIRMRLLRHVARLSLDFHEQTPVGATMYAIQGSLEELGSLTADLLPGYLRCMIMWVLTCVAMARLSLSLTFLVLLSMPLYAFVVIGLGSAVRRVSEQFQKRITIVSGFLQEYLSSVIQVQLLQREKFQLRRAFGLWADVLRAGYKRKKSESLYDVCSTLVVAAAFSAVVFYGGTQVLRNTLTIGGFIAFYTYMGRVFDPIYMVTEMNGRFQRASACITQVRDLLAQKPRVCDRANAGHLKVTCGRVDCENVHFGYQGREKLLHGLRLSIPAAQKCALVGPSGSGKSTLVRLIARLHEVEQGTIYIDGTNIQNVTLNSLRREVALVPQRPVLFNASLEENVRFGARFIDKSELRQVENVCVLGPILSRLPAGWNQHLGVESTLLSGGERQRIAIARALLTRPRVLILDESTSELDAATEEMLLANLRSEFQQMTTIIVTHRLAAVTWMDQIVVMKEGAIAGIGRHPALFSQNQVYASLFHEQERTADKLRAAV